jgi:hypothetical protein
MFLRLENLLSSLATETDMANKIICKNSIQGTGLPCLIIH